MYPNTVCSTDCYKPGDCDGSCTHHTSEESIQTSDTTRTNVASYGDYFPDLPAAVNDNTRPVVASQQPAPTTTPADAFRNMFAILHNVAMWDLEKAGIINKDDEAKWNRFNNDLTTFVLKLDDARLDALWGLVQARQPERSREVRAPKIGEACVSNGQLSVYDGKDFAPASYPPPPPADWDNKRGF